jgi:erythromycin esterase-like protein
VYGVVDLVTADPSSRQVATADARAYAKEMDAKFVETSSKANVNVTHACDLVGQHYFPDLDPVAFTEQQQESNTAPASKQASGLVLTNEKKQFQVFVDPKQGAGKNAGGGQHHVDQSGQCSC